jgi:hypothetical protein
MNTLIYTDFGRRTIIPYAKCECVIFIDFWELKCGVCNGVITSYGSCECVCSPPPSCGLGRLL